MLTIQFGQCGNQLGHSLFSKISEDIISNKTGVSRGDNGWYTEAAFEKWFEGIAKNGRHLARAILVDTEQKVVNRVCGDSAKVWTYSSQNLVYRAGGGSANNWSYGYMVKGRELGDETLTVAKRVVERLDRLDGILLLLSSAGGTGSGVGSHVVELLRNEFPTKTIVAAIVLPFSSGEVGTQNYNTLLTVGKFCDNADMVILFENEQIHGICVQLLRNFDARLQHLNDVVAQKLISVFQPVRDTRNGANSLVSQIVPQPCYRLAAIRSTPHVPPLSTQYESACKWETYVRHIKQTLRVPIFNDELTDMETRALSRLPSSTKGFQYSRSVANRLMARGNSGKSDPIVCADLMDDNLYAKWMPRHSRFDCINEARQLLGQDKFLALVTNNSQLNRPLEATVAKAWNAYTHSAFLHQYKRFGLEDDDFLKAFAKIENIIKVYNELETKTDTQ
ncbi:tubulin delta chain [Orussus abietinus]|uniref:tubulin delta chain n=1 Tax=Orussus abietinus TaxID=222816 RepID=UPI00062611D9|nr:tubulin delta chain [Orussus abietinus]